MYLGAHVSAAGGMPKAVDQAVELSCEAIQVFTRNQRQWKARPLDPVGAAEFRGAAKRAGLAGRMVSHASYLINLAAVDEAVLARSRAAIRDEIERCAELTIPYLCVHPGAHLGAGEEVGLERVAESVLDALAQTKGKRVCVLLENTAGQGTTLGYDLQHLVRLKELLPSTRVGFCLDTCHLFAAGYDLRTEGEYERVFGEVESELGLEHVKAFHLNDSKHPLGSRRDRHEHIGKGEIGAGAFERLVNDSRFAELPGLLETPEGPAKFAENLDRLRKMRRP